MELRRVMKGEGKGKKERKDEQQPLPGTVHQEPIYVIPCRLGVTVARALFCRLLQVFPQGFIVLILAVVQHQSLHSRHPSFGAAFFMLCVPCLLSPQWRDSFFPLLSFYLLPMENYELRDKVCRIRAE